MPSQSKSFSAPIGMSEFNADLKKESPEFYEKFQTTQTVEKVFKSEQDFLDELKKHAPQLHEKLKRSNFKFKLDEKTKSEFANLVHQSEEILSRLNREEKNSKK